MLTKCQEDIFNFVRAYQIEYGVPPTTREVAAKFEIAQPTAFNHLRAIGAKKYLEKLADGRWGIKVLSNPNTFFEVPIFGSIPAGNPQPKEESAEGTIPIDFSSFGLPPSKRKDVWVLKVQGDSMIDANIAEGDLVVLVRREPHPGDIVAALIDETTVTLKRVVVEKGQHILRAANRRYPDIVAQRIEYQGVAVGLIRRSIEFRL